MSPKALKSMLSHLDETDYQRIYTEDALLDEKTDSILAIRRPDLTRDEEKEALSAKRRFSHLMGALTLFSLERAHYQAAYGPSNLISHRRDTKAAMCEDDAGWLTSFKNPHQVNFSRRLNSFTLSQIKQEFENSPISGLIRLIIGAHTGATDTIGTTAANAAWRLCTSLYADVPGDIVASAVTCFEILLGRGGIKDDDIKRRLDVVVGFSKSRVKRLYDARNEWVHQGIEPDTKLVQMSISSAVGALKYFASLSEQAPEGTSHLELLQWLDLHAFIRKQHAIKPGALKKLCEHGELKEHDPFVGAEKVHREHSIGFYILSRNEGLMPTWKYYIQGQSLSVAPVERFQFDYPWALAQVLAKAFEQEGSEDNTTGVDFEIGDEIRKMLDVTTQEEVEKKTLFVKVTEVDESFKLEVVSRKNDGLWTWNKSNAQLISNEDEEGFYKLAQEILKHIESREDISV